MIAYFCITYFLMAGLADFNTWRYWYERAAKWKQACGIESTPLMVVPKGHYPLLMTSLPPPCDVTTPSL